MYIANSLENLLMNRWLNALIFSIDHPSDQEIQVCSYEVPEVTNGHTPGGHMFKFKKTSTKPLAGIH